MNNNRRSVFDQLGAGWLVLDFGYYLTLARALARLRPALERRREHSACERLSDEAVFKRLGSR